MTRRRRTLTRPSLRFNDTYMDIGDAINQQATREAMREAVAAAREELDGASS